MIPYRALMARPRSAAAQSSGEELDAGHRGVAMSISHKGVRRHAAGDWRADAEGAQ